MDLLDKAKDDHEWLLRHSPEYVAEGMAELIKERIGMSMPCYPEIEGKLEYIESDDAIPYLLNKVKDLNASINILEDKINKLTLYINKYIYKGAKTKYK